MEPVRVTRKNPGGPLLKTSEALTALLVFVTLLSATSCSSTVEKADEAWQAAANAGPKTSPLHTDPKLWNKAVTQVGHNGNASFSPDGRHILFISRDRLNHRQGQLYEMDLVAKTERRLSFQDGDVTEAVYAPDGARIFYASTTDEIKERPKLFYPEADKGPFPRTEIYSILPNEDLHERWTEHPGFDGFMQTHEDGKRGTITISRLQNGELQLFRSGTTKPAFEMVLGKPGHWLHSFTAHPREPVRAWVEENATSKNSRISVAGRGRATQSVVTKFFEVRNLHLWSSKDVRGLSSATTPAGDMDDLGMLLTAKLRADGPRQAFWVLPSKNCYQTLDLGPGEVQSLDLSADQKMLLWTLQQSSNSQVFVDEFKQPETLCEAL